MSPGDHRWTDVRTDSQKFGGTCVISRQPAFSIPFENSDYHEKFRWLLTTKRFLVVRMPIGNGSKHVTVTVVCAYSGRGKEANTQNHQIFDTVVGLAAGLGDTPVVTCSTNREGSRGTSTSRSAKAGSRIWDRRTNLLEQLNPCTPMSKWIQKRAWTFNEAFRAAVGDFEVVQRNLVPKHRGLKITLTLDT